MTAEEVHIIAIFSLILAPLLHRIKWVLDANQSFVLENKLTAQGSNHCPWRKPFYFNLNIDAAAQKSGELFHGQVGAFSAVGLSGERRQPRETSGPGSADGNIWKHGHALAWAEPAARTAHELRESTTAWGHGWDTRGRRKRKGHSSPYYLSESWAPWPDIIVCHWRWLRSEDLLHCQCSQMKEKGSIILLHQMQTILHLSWELHTNKQSADTKGGEGVLLGKWQKPVSFNTQDFKTKTFHRECLFSYKLSICSCGRRRSRWDIKAHLVQILTALFHSFLHTHLNSAGDWDHLIHRFFWCACFMRVSLFY